MSDRKYTFEGCSLEVKNPEFKHSYYEPGSNLEVEFGVSENGYKDECESYIDVDADMGSAYELHVAIKVGNVWHTLESTAVRIKIRGAYERGGFLTALQQTGLMTLPFYGKMGDTSEEQDDALREQT
jgi:hypothetical protein